MFCSNCGDEIKEGAKFCKKCGKPTITSSTENLENVAVSSPSISSLPADRNIVPDEIKGFNFGAFALNWIWAFAHRLWLFGIVILIVPCANLILSIYLGVKGNELAWKSRHFDSIKQFKDTQRVWTIVGIVIFAFSILIIIPILAAVAIPNFINAREKARFYSCKESLSGLRVAEEIIMTENNYYTNDGKLLANQMIGVNATEIELESRINKSCDIDINGGDWTTAEGITVSNDGMTFCIKGYASTRVKHQICVSPNGIIPQEMPMGRIPTNCDCF